MKESAAKNEVQAVGQTRRTFLQVAVLGGGASVLASLLPAGVVQAAGQAEALLLSCMDFRLMHDVERYMSGRGLRGRYDHIVVAGAALGAVTDRYPAWNKTFWEHLDIAIKLHNIHKVIVMDHRDCGAYKVILGEDFAKQLEKEKAIHSQKLKELAGLIKKQYPKLEIELLLMSLDGKVESIA